MTFRINMKFFYDSFDIGIAYRKFELLSYILKHESNISTVISSAESQMRKIKSRSLELGLIRTWSE